MFNRIIWEYLKVVYRDKMLWLTKFNKSLNIYDDDIYDQLRRDVSKEHISVALFTKKLTGAQKGLTTTKK